MTFKDSSERQRKFESSNEGIANLNVTFIMELLHSAMYYTFAKQNETMKYYHFREIQCWSKKIPKYLLNEHLKLNG